MTPFSLATYCPFMTDAIRDDRPEFAVKDDNPVARLAFETALRYHTDEELCSRFRLDPGTYEVLKANEDFKRAVTAYRREIDEAGTGFKAKARKLASETLPILGFIAVDPSADASDRIAAIKELARYAGYAAEAQANTGSTFAVQINIAPPP